jgi:hypothetical protein
VNRPPGHTLTRTLTILALLISCGALAITVYGRGN